MTTTSRHAHARTSRGGRVADRVWAVLLWASRRAVPVLCMAALLLLVGLLVVDAWNDPGVNGSDVLLVVLAAIVVAGLPAAVDHYRGQR